MSRRRRFLIYAPPYNPDSGGSIFLHELARVLRQLGHDAWVWPFGQVPRRASILARMHRVLRRPSILWKKPPQAFPRQADGAPVASARMLDDDDIVVYPEIVLGNPLGARNVVRWLLYMPGGHGPYHFTPGEMFFRAGEMSDLPEVTGGAPDLYVWRVNPLYQNTNRGQRSGICYAVRKGAAKPRIPETEGAILIDGLSHEQIAQLFNSCERFYSYDEATFYSQYAAICGCTSIVIPGFFPDREAWVAQHPIARYGVAYGLDDIDHAVRTQDLVLPLLRAKEAESLETVRAFVTSVQQRFG